MASWRRLQLVTLAVVMVTATLAAAQQAQAAAAFPALPSCPPAPLSLSPCIGYVFGVGSATLTACCSQLRSFLRTQAPCLCAASKLPPSPVGMLLGQAQTIFPNVCDLPNPCDDAADGDGEGSAPPSETTATTPAATTTPATEEPTSSAPPAADPDASGAAPEPAEDDSPAAAATGPAGAGSKLPQLLHAAGATSTRGAMDTGTVFVAVFLASVAAMYV